MKNKSISVYLLAVLLCGWKVPAYASEGPSSDLLKFAQPVAFILGRCTAFAMTGAILAMSGHCLAKREINSTFKQDLEEAHGHYRNFLINAGPDIRKEQR